MVVACPCNFFSTVCFYGIALKKKKKKKNSPSSSFMPHLPVHLLFLVLLFEIVGLQFVREQQRVTAITDTC
jgi:hypothetical protein